MQRRNPFGTVRIYYFYLIQTYLAVAVVGSD
jgi:hypothetical protein